MYYYKRCPENWLTAASAVTDTDRMEMLMDFASDNHINITAFTFFLLDLLLWSESDELSLVSMNSRLLKLSLPPRSLSLSPPADFLFFSSFLPPDFLLSLTGEELGEK